MELDDEYVRQATSIDANSINDEFVRTPSDLAYFNSLYADAYRDWQLAKMHTEQVYGNLTVQLRERLKAINPKTTVSEVESTVTTHPEYTDIRNVELSLEVDKVRLTGICEAIRCKKEMLISLGAHIRFEGEFSIRSRDTEGIKEQADQLFRKPRP